MERVGGDVPLQEAFEFAAASNAVAWPAVDRGERAADLRIADGGYPTLGPAGRIAAAAAPYADVIALQWGQLAGTLAAFAIARIYTVMRERELGIYVADAS